MELLDTLDAFAAAAAPGLALTIGMFDGVHRGHQLLISRVRARGRELGVPAAAFTFRVHPLTLLAPPYAPPLLSDPAEKAALLARHGLDFALMLDFTPAFAALSARQFIDEILLRRGRVRFLACGDDFRFGHLGAGDVALLRTVADAGAFELEVLPALLEDGAPIRSTRIRQSLLDGHLESANLMLGRPYTLAGRVVSGDRRGRTIGYPTANIEPPPGRLVPAHGVYAVRVALGDRHWGAMLNIGVRPTFSGARRTIEAFLFDFEGDLYDHDLALTFVARVREERRFESVESLVRQLTLDEQACRALLA